MHVYALTLDLRHARVPMRHGKPGKLQFYFPGLETHAKTHGKLWKKYLSIKKCCVAHFYQVHVM